MLRLLALVAALGALACTPCLPSPSLAYAATAPAPQALKTAHFAIATPFCSGCVDALVETTEAVGGVTGATVDLDGPALAVTFDDARTSPAAVRAHVERETRFRLTLTRVVRATR